MAAAVASGGLWLLRAAEKIDVLPEELTRLVKKAFPEAAIVEVDREGRDGDTHYDVDLKNAPDGRRVRLEVWPNAGITEIEEDLKQEELPATVLKALKKEFPKASIRKTEKRSEIRVTYRVDVTVNGRKREVTVSPRGRILEVEKRD
jgi:uncharacterized membrane protein YkoI